MNKSSIGIIIVLLVFAGGWYWLSKTTRESPPSPNGQAPAAGDTVPAMNETVAYTDEGFSPKDIVVPLGATVTFVNQSSEDMWVASAMHPAHTAYSGTSLSEHCPDTANTAFDECAAVADGGSFSFTFNKEGNWKYHNHSNASRFGSVTVTKD